MQPVFPYIPEIFYKQQISSRLPSKSWANFPCFDQSPGWNWMRIVLVLTGDRIEIEGKREREIGH